MNKEIFQIAKDSLLICANILPQDLENILHGIMGHNIDMADIFLQSIHGESWSLEEGIVKSGSFDINRGAGVRAISGEKTGFAYTNDIALSSIEQAGRSARSIVASGKSGTMEVCKHVEAHSLYSPIYPLDVLSEPEKISLLQSIDAKARRQDKRVKQVMANLSGRYEVILVVNSDGYLAADVRPLVRLYVTVLVEENGRFEAGSMGGGGRIDYKYFLENNRALDYAQEAARVALLNLQAIPAPAGTMPVVLGAGWPGVLLHEAVGHGLEGDFNRKGSSAFTGRIGEKVASKLCTVVDNGSLPGIHRGTLNIDDEGTPTQNTVLIENGILKNYMQDKLNAHLMGCNSTGNGRRESYAHIPLPRMTNTYLLPGKYAKEEIIVGVKNGIYAVNFSGGQVDITSGKFVFTTSEAYLIENGKVTRPIKDATLIGDGPTVLNKISMLGNDLKLDTGIGTCGKEGQGVPVGVGQPTLKIDELTVGGQT